MKIRVFDPYISQETVGQAGAEPVDFITLMKESDYISVHVPLSKETKGLIDDKAIALMKPEGYLINTARGAVVDEKALIRALRKRKIAGAGLDVFSVEPLPKNSPFLRLDNVILTPHNAGLTQEAVAAMSRTTAEECARIVRGEVPVNLVNKNELAARGIRV
jgi:D-3-phosphoglycerate dehydrogenase